MSYGSPYYRSFSCELFVLLKNKAVNTVLNQYTAKFKQNMKFQNTVTLEVTIKGRHKFVFMANKLESTAGTQACGLPVNSVWPCYWSYSSNRMQSGSLLKNVTKNASCHLL